MRMRNSWALIGTLLSLGCSRFVLSTDESGQAAVPAEAEATPENEDLITPIIDWFVSHGGIFSSKLEMRREFPEDPTSRFGMFAKADIAEDELLLYIPRKVLLTAGDDDGSYGGIWCPTVYNLLEEMEKGDESFYAPYTKYLASQSQGQLPSHWSDAGKALLREVMAVDDDDDTNNLPPRYVTEWLDDWYNDCDGSDDRDEEHASLLLVQRGWDDLMIPMYDMMSHRNGKWLNSKSNSVHKKKNNITVSANRDIKAGEEIYMSYNFCADCANKANNYGTAEILRDFGFVENYPQRWFFGTHGKRKVSFELDEGEDDLVVKWLDKKPWKKAKKFMVQSLDRLMDIGAIVLEVAEDEAEIPAGELWTIRNYHEAMINALKHALDDLGTPYDRDPECDESDQSCALSFRYDDLSWKPDDIYYAVYICDTEVSMSYEGFDHIEKVNSFYQKIDYWKDPSNDNVCFDIHHIIQMCGSYRPHYHEMVVHYTARFLPDITRVLWVGGGDSMLLHEILKYPNLEFVVGLELDQVITRLSYKHLGTQPHFDNPKVQWWFGDAAKSLLMLPEGYFGSFDMVLVDLSETVMSFSVTDGLDIMQALSLLLKPEGIFVKNELYLEKMADIFDYSIQIHFPGVPIMCSQCLIFGSNKVDFLYGELYEHNLNSPNLYIPAQADIEDRYQYYHDYRRNSTSMHLCLKEGEKEEVPVEQKRSPGILMIVEIEDIQVKLNDPKKLLGPIKKGLEKVGHKVISTATSTTATGAVVTVILRDGYVMVRTWPDEKYAAADIHMWSQFNHVDAAKHALVAALGSKAAPSSYRIVAGGMFGTKTWKDDDKHRGPHVNATCKAEVSVSRNEVVDKTVASIMLEETWKLVDDKHSLVAVLCGEEKDGCTSVDILKATGVERVVPLYMCPEIANEFAEGAIDRMVSCEKQIFRIVMDSVSEDKKFGSIIVDVSAPLSLSRIAYKVLKAKKSKVLEKALFGMAVMFDEDDAWRRNLLERFRKDIILYDPNFRSEVLFNTTNASMELGVVRSGDEGFVHKWKDIVSSIETRTGMVSDMRDVKGGLFAFDHDWKPSHFFLPADYDQRSPFEQWKSQQPVGYQSVFQFEPKSEDLNLNLSAEAINAALLDTLGSLDGDVFVDEAKGIEKAELTDVKGGVVGDGALVVGHWSGGNCVVLWDGRSHVDLNLFTFVESPRFANKFASTFTSQFGKNVLVTALRDIQPRGYGRVVSFKSDMADIGAHPHWAKFKTEQKVA